MADIKELPDEDWEKDWVPEPSNLEKNFDGNEINLLKEGGYPRPVNFNETNIQELGQKLEDVSNDIKEINDEFQVEKIKKSISRVCD